MKLLANTKRELGECLNLAWGPETSIVRRYLGALQPDLAAEDTAPYRQWLHRTSIREGARILPFCTYKGVEISLWDETSGMQTGTLKSIDGCVSLAQCKRRGYEQIVFGSGGNTGAALTEYGLNAGLDTYCFMPAENVGLLNSQVFSHPQAHLFAVTKPGLVKQAAQLFAQAKGFPHIPQLDWRYEASMYRGLFLLEQLFAQEKFDWLSQTISAAFGPIGIYRVLLHFSHELGRLPRFLGVQQEANCPIYRAWQAQGQTTDTADIRSTDGLLSPVMYDNSPQTYGTYEDLADILTRVEGVLTTINYAEFRDITEYSFDNRPLLDRLRDRGLPLTLRQGEIVEKTGLLSLVGTIKEIDRRTIPPGARVLCCLTSGCSSADGRARPQAVIDDLEAVAKL